MWELKQCAIVRCRLNYSTDYGAIATMAGMPLWKELSPVVLRGVMCAETVSELTLDSLLVTQCFAKACIIT